MCFTWQIILPKNANRSVNPRVKNL